MASVTSQSDGWQLDTAVAAEVTQVCDGGDCTPVVEGSGGGGGGGISGGGDGGCDAVLSIFALRFLPLAALVVAGVDDDDVVATVGCSAVMEGTEFLLISETNGIYCCSYIPLQLIDSASESQQMCKCFDSFFIFCIHGSKLPD